MNTIEITVLDSEWWKPGQRIVQISESDYVNCDIDYRKRFSKRKPEFWIYVDHNEDTKIPLGLCTLYVKTSAGIKNYSTKPFPVEDTTTPSVPKYTLPNGLGKNIKESRLSDAAPFGVSTHKRESMISDTAPYGAAKTAVSSGPSIVSYNNISIGIPTNYNLSQDDINTLQRANQILSSIKMASQVLCPPHNFKCLPQLSTLYCEKCGKTKPI